MRVIRFQRALALAVLLGGCSLLEPTVDALAEGMCRLLAQPDATRVMGERAAQTIQRHTWSAVTDELLVVLQRLIK